MGRLTQAISEGDGISVIPLLEGEVARLASLAEIAGAEAVAVSRSDDVEEARSSTALPVLVRDPGLDPSSGSAAIALPDADACVLAFDRWSDSDELEELHARLAEYGIDCAVGVRDEDALEEALRRLDPEIVLMAVGDRDADDDQLEHVLDLLPDVPAGKLVIAEGDQLTREQVVALERAGIDAIIVPDLWAYPDFSRALEDLVGGRRAGE